MPEVSIVIVCMNNPDILSGCLDSIKKNTTVTYETIVVAYLFSDDYLTRLRNDYPWVKIIESKQIRGFAENNNLALASAQGRYCFIINDDTFFNGPLIDNLVEDFNHLPKEAAVISPKILYPDGRFQYCGRAPFTFWRKISFVFHPYDGRWRSKFVNGDGVFLTYNIMEAAFMIKMDIFRQMGFFDEYYFFCPEDLVLSEKLNASGYYCYVDAENVIYHIQGKSLSRTAEATTPSMVKGMVEAFSSGKRAGRVFFGLLYLCFYSLKWLLYSIRYCFCREERDRIMRNACSNTIRAIFSDQSPKELFERYFTL